MIELKFRAWDKTNKKMIYDIDRIKDEFEGIGSIDKLLNSQKYKWTSFFIMQFTGLLDKNGKDIYEGDIVKNRIRTSNCIIEWKDLGWHIRPFGWNSYTLHQFESKDLEVIGNKYENPELMME